MTTTTDRTAQVLSEARQVRFSRVLLTLALGFFWGIGLVGAKLWLGLVIAAMSVRRGWRDGTGYVPPAPVETRESIIR
jgi:hypothetical protein